MSSHNKGLDERESGGVGGKFGKPIPGPKPLPNGVGGSVGGENKLWPVVPEDEIISRHVSFTEEENLGDEPADPHPHPHPLC